MTAHAVGALPAAAPAPRSTPTGGAQNPSAPAHFDHQLHAARQRTAPRDSESAPAASNARASDSKPHTPSNHRTDTSRSTDAQDPSMTAPAKTPATTPTTTPPTSAPPVAQIAQAAEVAETGAADAKVPTDAAEVDGHAASALAGAMLALLGAGALRPATAAAAAGSTDVLGQAGKTVATDAQAAMLLLGDAAGTTAATANPMPGMPTAANGLQAIAAMAKDESRPADVAPSIAVSTPPTPAVPTTPPVLHLQSPVGSQGFAQDLGQQIAWLGGENIKQARIRLHPEELGSLDVQVSVTHGRVDVVFNAQHPGAAAAVQQSLPQLDHMLAQHGLSLGHAEVGQHDRGDRQGQAAGAGSAALDEPGEIHVVGTTAAGQIGLLDAFA